MLQLPWTIVTFADNEMLRTINLESLARAAVLVSLYLLLLTVVTLVYLARFKRDTPRWLWPFANMSEEDTMSLYRCVTWTMTAILLLFVGLLHVLEGDHLLLGTLMVPTATLTVVVLGTALINRGIFRMFVTRSAIRVAIAGGAIACLFAVWTVFRDSAQAYLATFGVFVLLALAIVAGKRLCREWWRYPLRHYMVTSMLLWSICAVLPAYGFYKIAHRSEMNVVVSLERNYQQRAARHRARSLENYFSGISIPDRPGFLARARDYCGNYQARLSGPRHGATRERGPGAPDSGSIL
jgi:hypothetical protein